jgi:hypothetical protein
MGDSFKQFQKDFELFANQQAAEVEALHTILQGLLMHMFGAHPRGAELYQGLRGAVLDAFRKEATRQAGDQDALRKTELGRARAEKFFDEMRPLFESFKPPSATDH